MALDERPIPMYLIGIPSNLQEKVFETVQNMRNEARETAKKNPQMKVEYTEELIERQLARLKMLIRTCPDILDIGYQSRLINYIVAIEASRNY